MSQIRCPTCHRTFDTQASSAMPFCSDHCRQIDLHRWLTEDIAIPISEEEAGEDGGRAPVKRDDED